MVKLEHRLTSPRPAVKIEMPVDMYTVILANQRRGVDVDRRPSTNANSSNAGAACCSASEPGLDGTGDDGTGPTGRPIGVFW